jgi:mannose-6-phosphate isomerase-like protein (cupin superfamily)
MQTKIRRVVTAEVRGRGVITADASAPAVHDLGGGMAVVDLWKTHQSPARTEPRDDAPEMGTLSLLPPKGGSVFRIAVFPPEPDQGTSAADAQRMFEQMNAGAVAQAQADARSALMHRTDTVDYGIVLEGEISMLVDDGEVLLRAGDVVVQRGANHGWVNRSGKYCRMAFVLIDAARA